MNVSIIPWTTDASCRCRESDVRSVCHHCGRPMCREERVHDGFDSEGRVLSHELVGLGLERTPCGEVPIHCEDCDHVIRPPRFGLLVAGGVAVIAGRFLHLELPETGLAVLLLGLAGLIGGGLHAGGRWWRLRRDRPWLPWVPRLRRMAVEESLEGSLRLEANGDYRSDLTRAGGAVRFEATLGDVERHVFECYLRKFRLANPRDLPFRAGFLLLSGRAALAFSPGIPVAAGCPHVLVVEGSTADEPARLAVEGRAQGEWERTWGYTLEAPHGGELELPVRIVPSVLPDSGGRTLRLELSWGTRDRPTGRGAEAESRKTADGEERLRAFLIEELEVSFPEAWGEVDAFDERVVQTFEAVPDGEPRRRVLWRRVLVGPEEASGRRRCFDLQFERPVDLAARLDGRLAMALKGGLSGIDDVRWFYASGQVAGAKEPALTRVDVTFELALGSLRHRELRVVPDLKRDDERELGKPLRFDGVVPDHATVVALGRALTKQDYYLKSVVEDRPRTGASAHSVSRLWDLAGRVDEQIHPIEFHLTLGGEELLDAAGLPRWGTTDVTLTVQGTYSDRRLEETVRSRWDALRELIDRTLRARAIEPEDGSAGAWSEPPASVVPLARRVEGER